MLFALRLERVTCAWDFVLCLVLTLLWVFSFGAIFILGFAGFLGLVFVVC